MAAHAGAPLRSPRLRALVTPGAPCRRGADGPLWAALARPLREARWFGPPSPRARPPPGLRRCAQRESRAQLCQEPAGGVRRRPVFELEELGAQTRGASGAGACGPQLYPRQRASPWISGEHREEMEKKMLRKQSLRRTRTKRESLASLEASGLSYWGVVWAGWLSGFGIFNTPCTDRVKSGTRTPAALAASACRAG